MVQSANIRVGPRSDQLGVTGLLDDVSQAAVDASQDQSQSSDNLNSVTKKNPLNEFSSYNSVITLAVLTNEELADPDNTYRRNGPKNIILKSGGVRNQKARTSYEQSLNINTEYFIEDLEIQAVMGLSSSTRQTNATLLSFQVIEPYTMGIFLETLAVSAIQAGGNSINYLDQAYVLIIEFIGFDDQGNQLQIPNTTRYFPLKLSRVNFNVNAGGSVYDVSAYAWNEQALSDEVQRVNQDLSLTGETVADLLQPSTDKEDNENKQNLTDILNKFQLEQKDKGNVDTADAYVIVFPDDSPSKNDSFNTSSNSVQSATFDPKDNSSVNTVNTSSIDLADLNDFAADNINEIGRSRLDAESFTSGNSVYGTPDEVFEEGIAVRGDIQFNKNERYINILGGNRIQEIIENIILYSDYGKQLSRAKPDSRGMLKWFRIETATYNIETTEENIQKRGRNAKIYVFRVVPYLVHASHFVGPGQTSPGIPALERKTPKEYNYIYSGLNDDILDFDLSFNNAFYQAIQLDLSQFTKFSSQNGPFSSAPQNVPVFGNPGRPSGPANERGDTSNEASAPVFDVSQPNTNSSIVVGASESPETIISRYFNDKIVNGVDLITAEMEILGDPYYLADTGIGNYRAERLQNQTTSDGTIDYQYEEPHLILNFRTPIDIDQQSGNMQFPDLNSEPVKKFSGVYRVLRLTTSITSNKFTQRLFMVRLRNQQGEETDTTSFVEQGQEKLFPDLNSLLLPELFEFTNNINNLPTTQELFDEINNNTPE